jgi:hypothetical protein
LIEIADISAGYFFPFTFGDASEIDPYSYSDIRQPNFGEMAAVGAIFGIGYLFALLALDRRGRHGLATAFVVPGVIALAVAVIFFGAEAENAAVAGIVSVAAGLFIGSVGAQSQRRFTVWTGAFFATVGALLVAGEISSDAVGDDNDGEGVVFGVITIAFGVVMTVIATFVARLLSEPAEDELAAET